MEKTITFIEEEPEQTKEQEKYSKMLFVMENCLILKNVLAAEVKIDSEMEEQQSKDITTTITNPSMCDGFAKNVTMNGIKTTNQLDLQESRNSPKVSILSSAGSRERARTLALQDLEKAWQESEADYSMRSLESLMKLSPDGSSWKMSQLLPHGEALKWSKKLPKWGMIVGGLLSRLLPWERYTKGKGGSYLPTPDASDSSRGPRKYNPKGKSQSERTLTSYAGGKINPIWLEKVMGYPINWTELKPLETQLSFCKLAKLFESCRAWHKNKNVVP